MLCFQVHLLNSVMAKTLILLLYALLLTSTPLNSQHQELFFEGFQHGATNNITTGWSAAIEQNGILRLTNDSERVLGRAFYSKPIRFENNTTTTDPKVKVSSFSTAFAFAITTHHPQQGGHGRGHGFAFTISPSKELFGAHYPLGYLGLLDSIDFGNLSTHLFAVEFDPVYDDRKFGDINGIHVVINLNGMVSNKSVPAAYFTKGSMKQELDLKSGKVIQAWVDYNSSSNQLDVRLSLTSSKPTSPILSYQIDLSPILEDTMYVGFSCLTGKLASSKYILGWSFKTNGETKSLDLEKLPSLPKSRNGKKSMILRVVIPSAVMMITIVAIIGLLAFYLLRKMKNAEVIEPWELEVGPHRFPYKVLKQATCGFKDKHVVGFGGFGRVYKGVLRDTDTQVAVKRICNSMDSMQGWKGFMSEIATIGKLRHRNLVQLLGWCRNHGELLLMYDFMPNGSLDKHLFNNPETTLSWERRFNIIKGVASGLLYLHEEWEQAVIHRDIKAGNVLLDSEMNGRLGDFGLAKLYDHGSNPSTTRVVGTLGYLAPELTRTGKPTTSSDVFAFGVLLLEVACGRRPFEAKALPEELILVDWVRDRWQVESGLDVMDPKLGGEFNRTEALVVLKLGLMCSSDEPKARPSMRQVVMYLEGEVLMPDVVVAATDSGVGGGGGEGSVRVSTWCSAMYDVNASSYLSSEGEDGR